MLDVDHSSANYVMQGSLDGGHVSVQDHAYKLIRT